MLAAAVATAWPAGAAGRPPPPVAAHAPAPPPPRAPRSIAVSDGTHPHERRSRAARRCCTSTTWSPRATRTGLLTLALPDRQDRHSLPQGQPRVRRLDATPTTRCDVPGARAARDASSSSARPRREGAASAASSSARCSAWASSTRRPRSRTSPRARTASCCARSSPRPARSTSSRKICRAHKAMPLGNRWAVLAEQVRRVPHRRDPPAHGRGRRQSR